MNNGIAKDLATRCRAKTAQNNREVGYRQIDALYS